MYTSKPYLKVLSLPSYVGYMLDENEPLGSLTEIEPQFHREGWFYHRLLKVSWFEICHDGKWRAFKEKDPEQFLYELGTYNFKPLTEEEERLMRAILVYRNVPEFKQALYEQGNYVTLRDIHRRGCAARARFERFKVEHGYE